MKHYVILNGEYSDIQILGVTNDQDKAIKFSQLNSTFDNPCYIEEYEELQIYFEQKVEDLYYQITFKNNNILEEECYCFRGKPDKQISKNGEYFRVYVQAKNQKAAIKKASDLVAKYKELQIEYANKMEELTQCAKDMINKNRTET